MIRKKIYDPLLRICHFGIAFFSILLILSAYGANFFFETGLYRKSLWITHVFSGFALTVFLIVRILWGLIGPKYARWSEMWKLQEWRQLFTDKNLNPKWSWGHHPLAAIGYILFYLVLVTISATGIFLSAIEHNLGPFARNFYDQLKYRRDLLDVHEVLSFFILLFIAIHLVALYYHEVKDKLPNIQSMFTGYQYRNKETHDHANPKAEEDIDEKNI